MIRSKFIARADDQIRHATTVAIHTIVALTLALPALILLTAAGWMYLSKELDPILASLIVGFAFAAGAILALLTRPKRPPEPARHLSIDDLADAFMAGTKVGRSVRR